MPDRELGPVADDNRSTVPRVYFVVAFAVAFVTLLAELLLTKMLSFVFWNHIVYLIISIALLGYGASSTCILVLERMIRRVSPTAFLIGNLTMALFSLLGAVELITHLDVAVRVDDLWASLRPLGLTYLVLVAPFFFAGNVLVYIFFTQPRAAHRLYFWDLLGAAAGCTAFPWVISHLGTVVGTAGVAAVLGVPVVLLSLEWARGSGTRRAVAVAAALAMSVVAVAGIQFARRVDPRPDATKSLGAALNATLNPGVRREYARWDPVTRLDIVASTNGQPIDLGWAKHSAAEKLITFDGDATSRISPFEGLSVGVGGGGVPRDQSADAVFRASAGGRPPGDRRRRRGGHRGLATARRQEYHRRRHQHRDHQGHEGAVRPLQWTDLPEAER